MINRYAIVFLALSFSFNSFGSDKVLPGKEDWLFPRWERTDQIFHQGIANSLELIVQGVRILERAGTQVYIGLAPAKARLYPEMLPDGSVVSSDFKKHYADVNARLSAKGVNTLDLSTPLVEGKQERPMFARSDSHWTAFGAERAAQAVGAFLRPQVSNLRGKKPTAPLPDFVEMPIHGDLAQLIGLTKLEQVWIRPEAPARSLSLLDDDALWGSQNEAAPQIALVCTSMCAPPLGFPVTLSHVLEKPVDLYWRIGSYGQWRILSGYLESLQDRKQPLPKALIWIIMEGSLESGPDDAAWGEHRMSTEAWLKALAKATP